MADQSSWNQKSSINANSLEIMITIEELNICAKLNIKVPMKTFQVDSTHSGNQLECDSITHRQVNSALHSANTCAAVACVGVHNSVTILLFHRDRAPSGPHARRSISEVAADILTTLI